VIHHISTIVDISWRGRGMQELDVDEDRQPTKNRIPMTIPEGGPIPLHRDTTMSYILYVQRTDWGKARDATVCGSDK